MKKTIVIILAIGFVCVSCFLLFDSTRVPSNINEEEILGVISNAELVGMCPQKYINGAKNIGIPFSERYDASQKEQIVDEYRETLHDYYTNSSWAVSLYPSNMTGALNSKIINDNIDTGNLSKKIHSVTLIDDASMTVEATLVSWIKCVDQKEDKFVSSVIVNKDTMTYLMKKEENSWKIQSVSDHFKEFSPEDFDNGCGTYDTYEEAYQAISAFTVVNPL